MTLRVVIIGSGPTGITAGLLLARQGHRITLVDRDPGPVAGRAWERVGVMQFHLPHSFRSPGRQFLARRLPDVHSALVDAGGILDAVPGMPPEAAGMHIRRSVLERTLWELASRETGIDRVVGHVDEVLVDEGRACGVVVDGALVAADLVVDASGRAGGLTNAHRPAREGGSCGQAYAARQFQLLPGAQPGPTNGGPGVVTEHEGFLQLVFVHDAGTFTVLIVRAARDRELAELRREAAFGAALALLPEASTWTDPARSQPIDHVRAGAGLSNHYQGQPTQVEGLLAIGDAVCTTNPAGARGLSLGMLMAGALADVVESRPSSEWATALEEWCDGEIRPWFDEHLIADAWQLDQWRGVPTDPEGPIPWPVVAAATREHPEWMAVVGPFLGMATGPAALDGLREPVRELLRQGWQPQLRPGVGREDLVAAIATTTSRVPQHAS
jgi:2-polyprenyl-6-methoxyphenol hydroxylase-like FAD-dependent oxidoreductase